MEGKGCRLKSCLLLACLLVSACPCPLTAFEELANSSFEASSVTLLAFVDNDDGDDGDIYIMMKCLSVCLSRKMITSS